MQILIDTNILMDYFLSREPDCETSRAVINLCTQKKIEGHLAAHTITNLFYILRRDFTLEARRVILADLFRYFEIESIDAKKLLSALLQDDFKDFEDCLQDECAAAVGADYIVTRNVKDFEGGKIPAVTPEDFLKIYGG